MLTKDFRELAREFCREKDFNNVDLIEAAMVRAVAVSVAETTLVLRETTDAFVERRERANAPQ